jgi:CheY-like chemotaxis protein
VRILVADDSSINLEVARRILERQGALVDIRADGHAAVKYVREHAHELDIVLMDVQMPVLDGNSAAQRIRGELHLTRLPILALTAGALVGERQRCLESGMNDVVTKPFDPQSLIRKVRALVEQARGAALPADAPAQSPPTFNSVPIPGSLDAHVVKQMFGDDMELFRKLLERLIRDFADLSLTLTPVPEDEGSIALLRDRAHKLKGSSGMIGAWNVARIAGALKAALITNVAENGTREILEHLASALTTLAQESQAYSQGRGQIQSGVLPGADAGQRICIGDLDELRMLIETQDLSASDKFAEMMWWLRRQLDPIRFAKLVQSFDELDFGLAAQILKDGMLDARFAAL